MSENTNESAQDRNWRQLEASNEKLKAEVGKWRSLAIEGVAHRAGYDVSNGVTKLVLEKFSSQDFEAIPSPGDFSAFAADLDVQPNLATDPTPADTSPATTDDTAERQLDTLQDRAAGLASISSAPDEVSDLLGKADEAFEKGDYATSIMMKLQQVREDNDQ